MVNILNSFQYLIILAQFWLFEYLLNFLSIVFPIGELVKHHFSNKRSWSMQAETDC